MGLPECSLNSGLGSKPTLVDATVSGTTFSSDPVGWMRAEPAIPTLDALVSQDGSSKKISVLLVNRNKSSETMVELRFDHFNFPLVFETGSLITAAAIGSRNTVGSPAEISRTPISASDVVALPPTAEGAPRFQATVRKASVTALQFSFSETVTQGPRVFPNPFHPAAYPGGVIVSPLPTEALVQIFTITGERVTDLTVGSNGEAVWNGRNSDGDQVASGVYLVITKSAQGKKTLKVVVQN